MSHTDSPRQPQGATTIARRRVLTAGAIGLGLVFTPRLTSAAAADTSASDPQSRLLTIDGARNVRDIGGYSTPTGETVAWGRMYRSASLTRVSAQGVTQLAALNLSAVENFLSNYEVSLYGPDHLPAGVASIGCPIGDSPAIDPSLNLAVNAQLGAPWEGAQPEPTGANAWITTKFRLYVATTQARTSIGTALRAIAAGGGQPMLWHCDSGTYRTGWATAVLLTAIGVHKSEIYDDFLLSNTALGGTYCVNEYLDAAFEQAHISFGSFDGYLSDGLGVGPDVVDQLKAALLV